MRENEKVWEVLNAGITQIRVAGMGGTIGFDYVALNILCKSYFIDPTQAFWKKVRAVEQVIRKIESKRFKEENRKNKVTHARR